MRKKLINNIKDLFSLAKINLTKESTKEDVFPSILIMLRNLEDLELVSKILITSRYLFLNFDKFKKYYLKHPSKFEATSNNESILLKEEESISCFISDSLSKKNELVFFSDALYDGFYFMKEKKHLYTLVIDDKVKYSLKIKKYKFKLFDEDNKLILQAKAKSEKHIKFKKNLTNYDFVYDKKFRSFNIYEKEYLKSVKKKDANYDESSIGVFEGKILKIKHSRMEKYKFVVSKTTYFKDLKGDNILLNIISYALIRISRNKFIHYFKNYD